MKLSFGMIFSIFLIILFIVFAFYAITKILDISREAQIGLFVKNLQEDVNKMWKSPGSQEETYSLPNKVEAVCFTNNEFNNLIIKFSETTEQKNIDHIDILKITAEKDRYCISNINGEVKLVISKGSNEDLVTITGQN